MRDRGNIPDHTNRKSLHLQSPKSGFPADSRPFYSDLSCSQSMLHRLLFLEEPTEPAEREAVRQGLLDSCALESSALVRLKGRLDDLAKTRD